MNADPKAVHVDELERLWPDSARLWKAWMLSPSVEVCEALLRGESVPVDRLDHGWLRRFGLGHKLDEGRS